MKITRYIFLFLSSIDLFKKPIYLTLNKHSMQSTILGSFFSIFLFIFLSIQFFQSPLYTKTNPSIIDQTKQKQIAPPINLNDQNFNLYFALTDGLGNPITVDPTIYKINIFNGTIQINSTTKEQTYLWFSNNNAEQCDSLKEGKINKVRKGYLCANNNSFMLQGSFDQDLISAFSISLSICNNKTDGVICQSNENIRKFFESHYMGLSIFYNYFSYDVLNYSQPFHEFSTFSHIPVSVDGSKNKVLYFKKVELLTDDGFLFPNENKIDSFMIDTIVDNLGSSKLESQNTMDNFIVSVSFFSSKNVQSVTRIYQKIDNLLGSLNGILSFLLIIGNLVTSLQINLNFIKTIINELYEFPHKNLDIEMSKSMKQHIIEGDTPLKGQKESSIAKGKEIPLEEVNPHDVYDKKKHENNKKISININIFEFLRMKLGIFSKNSRLEYFHFAEERFYKEIDFLRILQKVQEFEKLKIILLNEKQRALFDLLAKPLLLKNEQKKFFTNLAGSEFFDKICQERKKIDNLKIALAESGRSDERKNTSIDDKLMRLVDPNLEEKIKKNFDFK